MKITAENILEYYEKYGSKPLKNGLYLMDYAIKLRDKEIIHKLLNADIISKISFTLTELYRINDFEILEYIIEYFKTPNIIFDNIYFHIINNIDDNCLKFLKKYKKYINWIKIENREKLINRYLFFCEENDNDNLLDFLLEVYPHNGGFIGYYIIINLNEKKIINEKFIIKLFEKNNELINEIYNDIPVTYYSLFTNLNIIKIFYKYKGNFNTNYYGLNCITYYLSTSKTINNDIIQYILLNKFDVNDVDYQLNTLGHLVFYNFNSISKENMKLILKLTKDINQKNYNGNTILLYILFYHNWKDYQDILIKKTINIYVTNKYNTSVKTLIKYKEISNFDEFLIFLQKCKLAPRVREINDIKITDYEYKLTTPFDTRYYATLIMINVLLNKYDELGIPYNNIDISYSKVEYPNINFNLYMNDKGSEILNTKFPYYCLYICDNMNYYIPPDFNKAVEYTIKLGKKYIIVELLLFKDNYIDYSLHNNIIIFDIDKHLIIHFEPHGSKPDAGFGPDLYDFIKKIFSSLFPTFKFLTPKDYLPPIGFQLISNETDLYDKKNCDAAGYCTAWCFWFVELYLNNTKYKINDIVPKAIKKLINNKYSFKEHIRNYSGYLTNNVNEIKNECGIPMRKLNTLNLSEWYQNNLFDCLKNNFDNLLS